MRAYAYIYSHVPFRGLSSEMFFRRVRFPVAKLEFLLVSITNVHIYLDFQNHSKTIKMLTGKRTLHI